MTPRDPGGSPSASSTLRAILVAVRPEQWYKQSVLYIAIVFSLNATNPIAWARITAGAILFSAVAGAMYIINDVEDVEQDRNHPVKRHRPIASGRLSVEVAIGFAALLLAVSFPLAWVLAPGFAGILALYVGQNVIYSRYLKKFLLIDLFVIGIGFVLRAAAGVVIIDAPMSPWLILCTYLAALMLGVGKRRGELENVEAPRTTRKNLDRYSTSLLDFMFVGVATSLLVAYSLYTFFATTVVMMATLPFAFYAVFRFAYLVMEEDLESPTMIFRDRGMMANFILWGVATVFILYGLPGVVSI